MIIEILRIKNMKNNTEESKGRSERRRRPYTLWHYLLRYLWIFCWTILFRPSPRLLFCWRNFLLRCFGAKIGKSVRVEPSVRIEFPWKLTVGDYSSIDRGVWLYSLNNITLGRFVTVSMKSFLCTGTHDHQQVNMPLVTAPIIIGDNCWLAADVFVAPGVTIGTNTVIGCRSTVLKDMPADMVCGGYPCRTINTRLSRLC